VNKMKVVLVLALLALATAEISLKDAQDLFIQFQQDYGKTYSTSEFEHAFRNFRSNLVRAATLQRQDPHATYGVTKFMDLSPVEFRKFYLLPRTLPKLIQIDDSLVAPKLPPVPIPNGASFDWRDKGAITGVYNQEQCGSCWAFSATETIESYWFLSGHKLPSLSPQQIVDCDKTAYGCDGGWTYWAFDYIKSAGGQDSWSTYPYTAQNGNCKFNKNNVVAKISGYTYVTKSRDENAMLQWVTQKGPLSVCVDAETWQYYKGGVVGDNCGQSLDHCVEVTGYSTQGSIDAWNVRNSWGTDWGLSGYLYVQRNKNVCAIADVPLSVTTA